MKKTLLPIHTTLLILSLFSCKQEASQKNVLTTKDSIGSKSSFNKAIDSKKKTGNIQNTDMKSWYGNYEGHFLRMEGESADPRGWASIQLNMNKDSIIFHISSYVEEKTFRLKVDKFDTKSIEFSMEPNENIKIIKTNSESYIIKSPYINDRNAEKNEVKLAKAK